MSNPLKQAEDITISLVYFRMGEGCVERVTIANNKTIVHPLTINEAAGVIAELSHITSVLLARACEATIRNKSHAN